MEWSDEEIKELIMTLATIVTAINCHQEVLDTVLNCINQLDARSQVTTSAYQSLVARLDKLENLTYGDGK